MERGTPHRARQRDSAPTHTAEPNPEAQLTKVTELLKLLDSRHAASPAYLEAPLALSSENQLVQVRLGIASALFMSLRCKDPDTASHSLRVALDASAWALLMELSDAERNAIELAGLLHDVGKIGVPDCILFKPAALVADETAMMERHRQFGLDILRSCCVDRSVLDIVGNLLVWYDGSRSSGELAGEQIPLGARMLAIVDAYDSMTSDKVYRTALSRERAMAELYRFAGTQFDPELVKRFSAFREFDRWKLQQRVARKWLRMLDVGEQHSLWRLNQNAPDQQFSKPDEIFQTRLLETMRDAVIFVDRSLRITAWNRAAERMTGIRGESVQQHRWLPSLLSLCDEDNAPIADADCPVSALLENGESWARRMSLRGRSDEATAVDVHAVSVTGPDGTVHGVVLTLRDISSQLTLEARCQSLHELATKDPLTGVANRAEFDRMHTQFVALHVEQSLPCSLIITDVDRFKQINDTFGHPAGDEVLLSFAKILRGGCRPGDLVARYGGEEFVILCADCDNASAVRRADELRARLASTVQPSLAGRPVTASFGVTEVQPGDTTETMLRRADRALLTAKEKGRNTVVQLGMGISAAESLDISIDSLRKAIEEFGSRGSDRATLAFLNPARAATAPILRKTLVANAPLTLIVEKLRGFISDHHATVEYIQGDRVRVTLGEKLNPALRRVSDRRVSLVLDMQLDERELQAGFAGARVMETRVRVEVRPKRGRDRRQSQLFDVAAQVMASLRAYLMAHNEPGSRDE